MKQLTDEQKRQLRNIKHQIDVLKYNLLSTDYQAIKYGEGALSKEEFEPMRLQRDAWRKAIRRLEVELAELKRNIRSKNTQVEEQ